LADELASLPFAAGAAAALGRIFAGRRAEAARPGDTVLAEAAAAWMELVRACDAAGSAPLATAEWWDLALRLFGDERRGEEKPVGAFELQGWIELLWEDAPHLVVAGMNDGLVPDAIAGDAFLPESLREKLGLKTNAARLARDAYLFSALAESRRREGRIDLLVGKNSAAGEPLRPSRLLLLGQEAELPARVRQLFQSPPLAGPPLPWTRAWKLTPPVLPSPARVSVTALRSWLECPFRFYLRHVLRMESVDPAKNEMDQLDFGTLCHAALEGLGLDPVLSGCTDPRPLREFLMAEIERQVRRQFGENLSLPLVVQLESARQRLGWVAEAQAAEQAAGWRIIAVEKKITMMIEGLEVVAKIDRIDQHQRTGEVRVLDYKTSDAAVSPASAHLRLPGQSRPVPPWAHVEYEGKPKVWADLQLPLYRHALAAEYPTLVACGYFNLPKASADARLFWWEPYPLQLQDSARACAEGVCRAIRAGEFWPPNEDLDPARDPFAALFQRGVAASVEWQGVTP
jgi:ATP-dependent helicase/nuclease subunit B